MQKKCISHELNKNQNVPNTAKKITNPIGADCIFDTNKNAKNPINPQSIIPLKLELKREHSCSAGVSAISLRKLNFSFVFVQCFMKASKSCE